MRKKNFKLVDSDPKFHEMVQGYGHEIDGASGSDLSQIRLYMRNRYKIDKGADVVKNLKLAQTRAETGYSKMDDGTSIEEYVAEQKQIYEDLKDHPYEADDPKDFDQLYSKPEGKKMSSS